jgi:hypothetical protein
MRVNKEFEEWTRTATAEELANAIHIESVPDPEQGPGLYRNTNIPERSQAFLLLRLTENLTAAIDRLVDASNSNTEVMAKLTAASVALTGVVAAGTILSGIILGAQAFRQLRISGFEPSWLWAAVCVSVLVPVAALLWALALWRDAKPGRTGDSKSN